MVAEQQEAQERVQQQTTLVVTGPEGSPPHPTPVPEPLDVT